MKKTNINDVKYNYAELDLALICEERYANLKPIDILTFTMLKNQESLSLESIKRGNNSFVDNDGNIFVMIAQVKLAKLVRTSERTLRDILKRLEDNDLIFIEQIGQNKCNKMYIGEPERTTTLGDYINKIGLEIVEYNKDNKGSKDIKLEKLNKIGNKKVASTGNTNNLNESLNNDSKSSTGNIVSQNKENIQQEIKQDTHKNIKLLKESGIKYIPYKKENTKILSMNTDKLKKAIEITIEKADKPNWNYLESIYDTLNNESNSQGFVAVEIKKTKFHNFTETFTQYSSDELDNIIEKGQREKFDIKDKYIDAKCIDDNKEYYDKAIKSNWNVISYTLDKAIKYAIENNLEYPRI